MAEIIDQFDDNDDHAFGYSLSVEVDNGNTVLKADNGCEGSWAVLSKEKTRRLIEALEQAYSKL